MHVWYCIKKDVKSFDKLDFWVPSQFNFSLKTLSLNAHKLDARQKTWKCLSALTKQTVVLCCETNNLLGVDYLNIMSFALETKWYIMYQTSVGLGINQSKICPKAITYPTNIVSFLVPLFLIFWIFWIF